jgi:hypothetical protein
VIFRRLIRRPIMISASARFLERHERIPAAAAAASVAWPHGQPMGDE